MSLKPIHNQATITKEFFRKNDLTPSHVDYLYTYVVEEANAPASANGFDLLLLALVRLDSNIFVVVRAARNSSGWTLLTNKKPEVYFDSIDKAAASLNAAEKRALNLNDTMFGIFKCTWCELVFGVGDTHNAVQIRLSTRLSVDETLCDECVKKLYDQIQPILENARAAKPVPRKGRNIIL